MTRGEVIHFIVVVFAPKDQLWVIFLTWEVLFSLSDWLRGDYLSHIYNVRKHEMLEQDLILDAAFVDVLPFMMMLNQNTWMNPF